MARRYIFLQLTSIFPHNYNPQIKTLTKLKKMVSSSFLSDTGKWWNVSSNLHVPRTRHIASCFRINELVHHSKRSELLSDLRHANVRRHGVQVHQQDEQALPVVAPGNLPGHVWVRVLLCGRCDSLLG